MGAEFRSGTAVKMSIPICESMSPSSPLDDEDKQILGRRRPSPLAQPPPRNANEEKFESSGNARPPPVRTDDVYSEEKE